METITRAEAIEYLNSLGDVIDWGDGPNAESYWSLDSIRAEVLRGDEYDGMNIWQTMLEELDRQDITTA